MPLVGTAALTEVWAKCKAWFGRSLASSTTATTASITLKNNAGDDLSTASIPAATTSAAGVMSADDKTKLDGIAAGATANTGTVTNVTGTSPITVTNGTTTPSVAHANSGVTAGSKGDTSNKTPAFGGTFKALSGTVNATGHLTAFAEHTVKIPDTAFGGATASAAGSKGLVPAPGANQLGHVLTSIADWTPIEDLVYEAVGSSNGFVKIDDSATDIMTVAEGNLMTDAQVTKLAGIATGAEVNQNAFSNVKVGSTTVAADGKTDTLELVAGSNVTLTPDATNDKVTIAATDTKALGSMTGTLGVNHGGTGGTTAAAARTNLEVYSTSDVYTKTEVDSLMTGAAQFQGTVSAQSAISGAAYKKGWYWVVATAGTYVGQACEVGDMIFAIKDKGSAYAAGDFSVVQNNIVEMTAAEVDAICV